MLAAMAIDVEGTGGIAVTIGPLPIPRSGMTMWFRSDDIRGSDGDRIAGIGDASGNGNHLYQADPTKQPILKTGSNGINGHSGIQTTTAGDRTPRAAVQLHPTCNL